MSTSITTTLCPPSLPAFRSQLRPPTEFFNTGAFSFPAQRDLIPRVETNLKYYSSNYILILLLGVLYQCYHFRSVMLSVIFSLFAGIYLFSIRAQPIDIRSGNTTRIITMQEQSLIYYVLVFAFNLYVGGSPLLYSLAVCSLVSLLHAILRQRSLSSRTSSVAADIRSKITK